MKPRLLWIWMASLALVAIPSRAGEPQRPSPDLHPPFKIDAGERPLDVGRSGHAAPYFADVDGDGRRDLLVGQYYDGRVRLYRNEGTNAKPRFDGFEYLMADERPISVPVFCCIGFTPQLVDLDNDGRLDLLSGSAPGEIYLFRARPDRTFAAGEKLSDRGSKEITPGTIATAFAVDWDGDGRLDLVLGSVTGDVHVAHNISEDHKLRFEQPKKIDLDDPREDRRESAPVVADWDGDGRFDLVVGMEDGSVYWFRNTGPAKQPQFAAGECLVPVSPLSARDDNARGPHDCGQRIKPCVADFNDDGRLDLLVGDWGGWFDGKPEQTSAEIREEQDAIALLPRVRAEWVASFGQFRKLAASGDGANEANGDADAAQAGSTSNHALQNKRNELLERVTALKAKIDDAERAIALYKVQQQTHGYVWVYLRKPAK